MLSPRGASLVVAQINFFELWSQHDDPPTKSQRGKCNGPMDGGDIFYQSA